MYYLILSVTPLNQSEQAPCRSKRCTAFQRVSWKLRFAILKRTVSRRPFPRSVNVVVDVGQGFGRKMFTDYEVVCKVCFQLIVLSHVVGLSMY